VEWLAITASARMTELNHTDTPASTWTSPISVAVGATRLRDKGQKL
jgi:hypothetical protein